MILLSNTVNTPHFTVFKINKISCQTAKQYKAQIYPESNELTVQRFATDFIIAGRMAQSAIRPADRAYGTLSSFL